MNKRTLLTATALLCLSAPAIAQILTAPSAVEAPVPMAMDVAEQRQVLTILAETLEQNFVFPVTGAAYASLLRRNAAADTYARITDPVAFGEKVTADLQSLSNDGHLRLAPSDAFRTPRRAPAGDQPVSTLAKGPDGLEEAKMIGNVAYLRFNAFPGNPLVARAARHFLLDHADAGAVIIDARPNRGGGLAVMDAILPLLYDKPTTLVRMDTRASAGSSLFGGSFNLVNRDAPSSIIRRDHVISPDRDETRLQSVPVYYLVSRRSASAAEHLALAFKRTGRATLVGETTRGAGHYGELEQIGDRFTAFIPVGRTYDPDTNQGWEGTGIAPDVAVPADQALDKALELARAATALPG